MTMNAIPGITVHYAQQGISKRNNELGMRPMQERAYARRGEQYLLIKSPPASGKSRALMFIALDKVRHQGLRQAIIIVPERAIGASFNNARLTEQGFEADWEVKPQWNLCNAPENNEGTIHAVGEFLKSDDSFLICTHATFRFAVDRYGVEAFDDRLIAIDEFHHVSANPNNKLGLHLQEFMARGKTHIVAMTGSYFRGDSDAILMPEDEAKFETVTYTYYEQLNGYDYLKSLDIGYYFYSGSYLDDIMRVLNPDEKTILHIPNVNSRESTTDKYREVERIINTLGEWEGTDPETGFLLVRTPEGKTLRIADLVEDDARKRNKVITALKDPNQINNRDHVDIIIALGMAKEGFDWIWCEHALTVGYRSSLTEIVQIIGRATRDAPGKTRAHFTNLIAEPDASQSDVLEAVNDTLKAIAASLLMEQVLAPRFEFRPRSTEPGDSSNDNGMSSALPPGETVILDEQGNIRQVFIKGLKEPQSADAKRICKEDIRELIADFLNDRRTMERGLFDPEVVPEELTVVKMGQIIKQRYPSLDAEDQEAVRQHVVTTMNLINSGAISQIGHIPDNPDGSAQSQGGTIGVGMPGELMSNTGFVDGTRKYILDVQNLDIDLIDQVNPFSAAYAVLSKTMTESRLREIEAYLSQKRIKITPEEARLLAERALQFKKSHNRLPDIRSADPWEVRLAEGARAYVKYRQEGKIK